METQKKIKGVIDPELINIHMEAASKDVSRRAIKCLLMRHRGGRLHIITTNGCVLLHTTLTDIDTELSGTPDFEVMVEVSRKLKKNRKDARHSIFTIEGDKVFFRGFGTFDAFEIYTGGEFPKLEEVERSDKARKPMVDYKPIAPWLLDIIHRYVGEPGYARPEIIAEGGDACFLGLMARIAMTVSRLSCRFALSKTPQGEI